MFDDFSIEYFQMTHTNIPSEHNTIECTFCKVISGEIPSYKLYENDEILAFLNIFPVNSGHALVIPKDHIENIYGLPDETLCRVIIAVKKVAIALKHALDADGINLEMNNESAAGQEIDHAHIHVIPRFKDDGLKHWPFKPAEKGELESIKAKIQKALED